MNHLLLTLLCLFFSTNAMSGVNITISEINADSILFDRAGMLNIGVQQMHFLDKNGKGYKVTCGGDNITVQIFNESGKYGFMVKSSYVDCSQKIFTELKSEIESGKKLSVMDLTLRNKIMKNGSESSLTEVIIDIQFDQ